MRAIFIGGPLHGETKQVEPGHDRCSWMHPCRGVNVETEVVVYHRRFLFGDTAIFTLDGENYDKPLVEALERGLQLSPEPPLREVIKILFSLHAVSYFLQTPTKAEEDLEYLAALVQSRWKRQQDFKSRK